MSSDVCAHKVVRSVLAAVLGCLLAFSVMGCSESAGVVSGAADTTDASGKGGRSVSLIVECEENLFLSRYDLDLYVDDELRGSLDHGATEEFVLELDEGEHSLRVAEKGDESVDGNVRFAVNGEVALKYKVKCTAQQVEIEAIDSICPPTSSDEMQSYYHDELHRAFEDAGFTNIREVEQRDLSIGQRERNWRVGSVTIAEVDGFSSDDAFFSDDEVVITYHVLSDLNAPAASSALEGMNYSEVVALFEKAGFINVTTAATSASGVRDTVSQVRIGGLFGDSDFSADDTFAFDAGVKITYYSGGTGERDASDAEPVPEADLNRLLNQNDADASWFSSAYKGRTITFNGWVGSLQHHEDYDTRWDVLILKGDRGSASGDLNFRLTDVSFGDMNVVNGDALHEGDNITITAEVGDYNATAGWLELDPVSISLR